MKIIENGDITLVKGIKASGINCGIKQGKKDLALIYSQVPACAASVFTRNYSAAAPVMITKEHLKNGIAQAIIVNSGIANAATGKQGLDDAKRMASRVGELLNIPSNYVVVASTGRIGKYLPMEKILSGINILTDSMEDDNGTSAAEAILTTDTFKKELAVQIEIQGTTVTLAGIAKGAGMIRPDMATMLTFILSDAKIDSDLLQRLLVSSVNKTFNCITIDGDTSTNDMVIALANGLSDTPKIFLGSREQGIFVDALDYLCQRLALMIVEDGEGGTKVVCISVRGAKSADDAKTIAFRIAESPLVKTSFYGRSCNWGRILAAIGSSGILINPDLVDIFYGPFQVTRRGTGVGDEEEKGAQHYLESKHIDIVVDLNMGNSAASVWTTDLTPDYVHINADYPT